MKKCRGFVSENGRLERHQYCPLEPHGMYSNAAQYPLITLTKCREGLSSEKWGDARKFKSLDF